MLTLFNEIYMSDRKSQGIFSGILKMVDMLTLFIVSNSYIFQAASQPLNALRYCAGNR